MTDDELSNFEIIETKDEGNCAIHSVLYGLQRVYANEQIVSKLNTYLDATQQISEVVLEEKKPKIRYSTDTTNAIRQALYNYYHRYENDLHLDLKLLDTDSSKITSNNSTNELPHYKNIITDKVWLTDIDLYYICKLFDICIKLRKYEDGKYYWRLFNHNIDIDDIDSNTEEKFKEQCEKIIHIQFVNNNHFQVLIPKRSKLKEPVKNSNKTSKRRILPLNPKKKYNNKTTKNQYPSNNTIKNEPKSNVIIFSGLALTGFGVGVLVAMNY